MARGLYAGEIRPPWPFTVNRDSPQAQGLALWAPLGIGGMEFDLVANLAFPATGGPPLVPDPTMGQTRKFTAASSQYLSSGLSLGLAQPLSLACWFNTDNVAATQNLVNICTNAGIARWALVLAQTPTQMRANSTNTAGTGADAGTSTAYVANSWTSAVGVFASDTSRAGYLNGTGKGSDVTSISVTGTNTVVLGARWNTTIGNFMSGLIADCRIYNRVLNDVEIASYFSDPRLSLDLYYPLGRKKYFLPWT